MPLYQVATSGNCRYPLRSVLYTSVEVSNNIIHPWLKDMLNKPNPENIYLIQIEYLLRINFNSNLLLMK